MDPLEDRGAAGVGREASSTGLRTRDRAALDRLGGEARTVGARPRERGEELAGPHAAAVELDVDDPRLARVAEADRAAQPLHEIRRGPSASHLRGRRVGRVQLGQPRGAKPGTTSATATSPSSVKPRASLRIAIAVGPATFEPYLPVRGSSATT
jgi:hypothetical protein